MSSLESPGREVPGLGFKGCTAEKSVPSWKGSEPEQEVGRVEERFAVTAQPLEGRTIIQYLTGTKVHRLVTSGKLCFERIDVYSLAKSDLGLTVLRVPQNTKVLPALPKEANIIHQVVAAALDRGIAIPGKPSFVRVCETSPS